MIDVIHGLLVHPVTMATIGITVALIVVVFSLHCFSQRMRRQLIKDVFIALEKETVRMKRSLPLTAEKEFLKLKRELSVNMEAELDRLKREVHGLRDKMSQLESRKPIKTETRPRQLQKGEEAKVPSLDFEKEMGKLNKNMSVAIALLMELSHNRQTGPVKSSKSPVGGRLFLDS